MAIDIGRFQSHQNVTGRVLISGQGDQTRTGTSGKVASWFKSVFRPGTFATENQKAMRAFIQSISDKYGSGMGRVATRQLQKDLDAGLPLSGARIRATLEQVDQAKVQRNTEMNTATIQRMSRFEPGDPFNTLGKIISETAQEMGLGGRTGELRTDVLIDRIRSRLESNGDKNTKLITQEDAKRITQACVREGLQAICNLDRCKSLAQEVGMQLDSPKLTALKNFLETHHIPASEQGHLDKLFGMVHELKVKANTDLTALNALVSQGETFFDVMSGGGLGGHQIQGNMLRLIKSMATATESLGLDNVGVDDHNKTIESLIKVFVESGKISQEKALRCFGRMTSDASQKLLGASLLYSDPFLCDKLGTAQGLILSRIYSQGSTLLDNLAKATGMEEKARIDMIRRLPQYSGVKDLDVNTLHALRSAGVNLPFGSRALKGQLSEGFRNEFQALVPGLAMSGTHDKDGVHENCLKDMGRGTYKLNGRDITRPGNKFFYSVSRGVKALSKAIPDLSTRKIVTSIAHQGLMGTFLNTQILRDDSAFQAVISELHGEGHVLQYNIRTDDPDKIYIDFNYQTRFNRIVNDTGDAPVNPGSHYDLGFTLAVDRRMAEQGVPQVQIQGPLSYDIEVRQ